MIKILSKTKNAPQMIHKTAKNKIRNIKKSLITAGGKAIEILKNRLKLWENK